MYNEKNWNIKKKHNIKLSEVIIRNFTKLGSVQSFLCKENYDNTHTRFIQKQVIKWKGPVLGIAMSAEHPLATVKNCKS